MQVDHASQELASISIQSLGWSAVPGLLPDQIGRFTMQALRARPVRPFDPGQALNALRILEGASMLAIDIGGDKLVAERFAICDGEIAQAETILTRHGDHGVGYLAALQEVAEFAWTSRIPVGISFAGPVSGTRLVGAPNLPAFASEFHRSHGGDFASLFWNVSLANDAEAGIMAAALMAARHNPGARDVIYIINGSGLGGAVLTGNMIYAAEPGHIEVAGQLNSFDGFVQRKQCGLDGATHVCIEAVGASKAGVEDIWHQIRGDRLTGRQISARYIKGDDLARALYHNSAWITAHAIKGMAVAFGLFEGDGWPVIVGHGGIFQVPGYGQRVCDSLSDAAGNPRILLTKDFSANTCLEGAAIAAISDPA
jgi:predicted NBD/HSP70 family sugar kinase